MTTYAEPGHIPKPDIGESPNGPVQISAVSDRQAALLTAHTTASRDALAGTDLWVGRTLWNVTTGRLEVWDGDSWEPVADLSGHTAASDPHTGYIRKALATAKGDLLVATASGVVVRKAVGANGRVLTADSAQSDGLAWTDLSGTYLPKAGGTMTGALLLPDGTAAAPALALASETNLGLYRSGAQQLAWAAVGTQGGLLWNGGVRSAGGSAANPAYAFISDIDTGIYRPYENAIYLVAGGVNAGGVITTGGVASLGLIDGTTARPAFSFLNDLDTGIYRLTADVIGLVAGGSGGKAVALDIAKLYPTTDNTVDLGSGALRFKVVYAGTGTINTSDGAQKNTIRATNLGLSFIRRLHPVTFKFNDGSREHEGLVAQEVKEAYEAEGVDDRAIYVDPAVGAAQREAAGPPKKAKDESAEDHKARVDRWREEIAAEKAAPKGLRYSEFIGPLIRAVQEQQAVIESQQAQIDALTARLDALEAA